jgi:glycolate oxidase iron-sulfur subunit
MLEGKLDDPAAAEEALSTCLLCGACTTACYAKVAVPDIVLEGRRVLRARTHWLVKAVSRLLRDDLKTLARLLKAGYLFKRLGLSRLARPLLRALGLSALATMDEHSAEAPWRLLDERLAAKPQAAEPKWLYFAPCGPRFVLPRVGEATWSALTRLEGPGRFLDNPCCGLLAYNYGDLDDARALAREAIENAEAAGAAPVIGDCSSCVAHLKSYPQLFLRAEDSAWRARAETFAARVKDAVEIYGARARELPLAAEEGLAAYHDSCRALNGQNLKNEPRAAAKACAGASLREMGGAGECCGGAGAFSFVHPDLSDEVLRRKVGSAAKAQAAVVLTSSTSCLLQLDRGFKKYYPEARALHLSEFVAGALEEHHGS